MTIHPAVAVLLAYVLGSIPAAYIAGRSRGIDLRKHGSGNLGATNVFRVLGAKVGITVFLFDMAKGAVPVLFFWRWTAVGEWPLSTPLAIQIACGIAAIAGHVRPMFLKFGKGGKGVATAAGVFLGLAPIPAAIALASFAAVLLATGYVSLGSLSAATILPIAVYLISGASPLLVVAIIVALFVFWTHRANIARLRRGEEHRFGRKPAG
jgi:acyl phosphate:glycerol-3-phosphate acyltransferase